MNTTAFYPGSFDPFTNGHLDVVKKASRMFEEVIVAIGINPAKKRIFDKEQMKKAMEETFALEGLTNCRVEIYEGLAAEFAKEQGASYMVRGLRNTTDYNYEENIAEVNKLINPDLEYVYFRAENVGVSSSMVRELMSFGKDVSRFLPGPVFSMIVGNAEKDN